MPRRKEFDESEALTGAMHAFRRDGYNLVSVKDLEQATGLSSGSLYNSFGSKDALFAQSLTHYNKTVVAKRVREHLENQSPAQGLRTLFLSLLNEPGGTTYGCLLTNSAIEFSGQDREMTTGIRQGMDILEKGFQSTLTRLAAQSGINQPEAAFQTGALRLLTFYQGLLVLIRLGRPRSDLEQVINYEINAIIGEFNGEE